VSRAVTVPLPATFQSFGVSAWVLVVRADELRLSTDPSLPAEKSWNTETGEHVTDAPGWAASSGVDFVRYSIPLSETDFLRRETRQPWTADVWRVLGNPVPGRPPGSYISLRFHPSETSYGVSFEAAERDNQVAAGRYGVTRLDTGLSERSALDLGIDT
jgi:hypothetical protein